MGGDLSAEAKAAANPARLESEHTTEQAMGSMDHSPSATAKPTVPSHDYASHRRAEKSAPTLLPLSCWRAI